MITLQERERYRAALKQFDVLISMGESALASGTLPNSKVGQVLETMTDTVELPGQVRGVIAMRDTLDQQYDSLLRDAAQYRFSPFCEYMYRHEPPALHHEFLINHMEAIHNKEIMRLAISMPPGAAKSSYASVRFAAWHLGRRPDDRWLQGAHTQTFAKDRLGKPVRNLIADTRYREVFPHMVLNSSSSAADYFEFMNGAGYYKAIGVGVGISGFRADIGAIDDPIASREDAESPTSRRKLHAWFEDDFGTRPMPGSPIYVVATRWHEDDLIGYELDKMAQGISDYPWEVINIPAIAGDDDPIGREPGEGLWPEVFGTEEYLKKKRGITSRSWNSLYQGTPMDEEGGILKAADIHRYTTPPKNKVRTNGDMVQEVIRKVTLSVDLAEKAGQRNDYSAATVWVETFDKKHYLIHANRIRKEFNDQVKWIEHLAKTFNVDQILCEDRGAGTQYLQVRKEKPGFAPVIGIATKQQSKDFRFDGVTPMFAAGEVLLPEKGNDWIADLENELLVFPNGKNDDYVDSVGQYLHYARGKGAVRRGSAKVRTG